MTRMRRRWHAYLAWGFVLVTAVTALGCATRQEFELLPARDRDNVIAGRTTVLDARVTGSRSTSRMNTAERLTFFVPRLRVSDRQNDAYLSVESVVKGTFSESTLELHDYRHLTPGELKQLPEGQYGNFLYPGLRLRLAFDRYRHGRFERLQLVPLGNTAEYGPATRGRKAGPARAAALHKAFAGEEGTRPVVRACVAGPSLKPGSR